MRSEVKMRLEKKLESIILREADFDSALSSKPSKDIENILKDFDKIKKDTDNIYYSLTKKIGSAVMLGDNDANPAVVFIKSLNHIETLLRGINVSIMSNDQSSYKSKTKELVKVIEVTFAYIRGIDQLANRLNYILSDINKNITKSKDIRF